MLIYLLSHIFADSDSARILVVLNGEKKNAVISDFLTGERGMRRKASAPTQNLHISTPRPDNKVTPIGHIRVRDEMHRDDLSPLSNMILMGGSLGLCFSLLPPSV